MLFGAVLNFSIMYLSKYTSRRMGPISYQKFSFDLGVPTLICILNLSERMREY